MHQIDFFLSSIIKSRFYKSILSTLSILSINQYSLLFSIVSYFGSLLNYIYVSLFLNTVHIIVSKVLENTNKGLWIHFVWQGGQGTKCPLSLSSFSGDRRPFRRNLSCWILNFINHNPTFPHTTVTGPIACPFTALYTPMANAECR